MGQVMPLDGYIKLYRKLLENAIFQNEKLLKVFIWCLLKASHKEHEQLVGLQKIILQPGQFIYGRLKAAEELRLKESTVNKYMTWLKNDEIINIKSSNKYSLVSIEKWELYQIEESESNSKNDNKGTTKEQQSNTNKNVKNDKNKTYSAFFEKVWSFYPNKKGKAQVSDTTKEKLYEVGFEQLAKCIDRYKTSKPKWQAYQNGSTFFYSGYVDYLDENYKAPELEQSKYRDMTNYKPGE
jgi:hypothetical protein